MDIEFICTDQGAKKTIEEALQEALGSQITCKHFNCDKMKEALDNGKDALAAVNLHDSEVMNVAEPSYEAGQKDFNGNV